MASMTRRRRKAERDTVTNIASSVDPMSSLVASAVKVRITSGIQNIRWGGTEWQQEGWLHFDTCPEFHAAIEIGANNLSRARLFGAMIDPETGQPGTQPTTDPDVVDIMSQLFGGGAGQSQALSSLSQHIDVAGDCWVLATDSPDMDQESWEILATTEVTSAGGERIMVQQLNGIPRQIDVENELLIRVWKKHPRHRWDADSPTRSLLPVLRELSALTAMVSATVKSRLASAGILWLPSELTLPPVATQENGPSQVRSEATGPAAWLDLITEAMLAPIRDPDSAGAVVPLVATVAGNWIDKIVHMEFGKDLDDMIEPLRQACIKRLAVGVNMPPTVLLGIEDANHWTAWTITEDYAKAYIAPKLEMICDALTTFYLRPALRLRAIDPKLYAVYFDITQLYPKQLNTENAQAAYDTHLLKGSVYMEAMGFSESDMADDEEQIKRLIIEMLTHANPEVLAELATTIAKVFPGIVVQQITPPGATVGKGVGDGTIGQPVAPALPGSSPATTSPSASGQAPPPTSTPSTKAPVPA